MTARHLILALLVLAAFASAQDPAPPATSLRRTAQIGRVAEADAPRIDGHLEDPCWKDAPSIGKFVMVEPWEGRVPTQRTVVRLLHDRHNLYLGLWCYDDSPQEIRASMRARDARLDPDDRVEILLDPFENRRTAYFFQIGAGGSLGDILISNDGAKFDKPWDTIWSGAATATAEGWMAEIAIPFRSIPRREGARSWGFNIKRYVRTRNEEYQWENATQSVMFYRPSQCGTIEGFGEIDGGIGLEVVPYATAGIGRDRTAADRGWETDLAGGGEMYYRLSPSLTLAATLFTDFAETENDDRQINLNRFPLFFPEKRDFFLEGISYYSFGATNAGGTTFLPFFTRRIGLAADGSKIPLLGGLKLTGQVGRFDIGLLDVQTDDTVALEGANLGVARVKYAIDDQTTIGMIGTSGEPTAGGGDQVAGVDFYHRIPRFVGDMDLRTTIDLLGSTGTGAREGESVGALVESHGRQWDWQAGMRWVGEHFAPSLGFVRRTGSRATSAQLGYMPRTSEGGLVRNYNLRLGAGRSDTWSGQLQEQHYGLERFGVDLRTGDSIFLWVRQGEERVDEDFTLFRGSRTVFRGDYETTRGGLQIVTTEGRPWNGTLAADTGGFFDGHSDSILFDNDWRVSALVHLGGGYRTNFVDLGPDRSFTTRIATGRFDLHFTPALSLRNLVQFDNESNVLGWQSRLRWSYAPGSDFFAVLGTGWEREDDGAMTPTQQSLEFKLSHSVRF